MKQNNYSDTNFPNSTLSQQPFVNTSGQGFKAPVPEEIKGWSWGAALLTWIWGISHKVWLSLLVFIPYAGWVVSIVLGYKGNEWAWQSQHYDSIAEFKERERKWTIAGIIVLGIIILLLIVSFGSIITILGGLSYGLSHLLK